MEYRKLRVWQESFDLAVKVHRAFVDNRDFGFKDQIKRSSVSIPSNIAEGEERETVKEAVRYLYIAKGSCGELLTQILLAKEFGYLSEQECEHLSKSAEAVSKMLASLIKYRAGVVKENPGEYLVE